MVKIRQRGLVRETTDTLNGNFGIDRQRPLAVALKRVDDEDFIELWPKGTRQRQMVRLVDVYRFAVQCAANRDWSRRMLERKEKKNRHLAALRIKRVEKRLFK